MSREIRPGETLEWVVEDDRRTWLNFGRDKTLTKMLLVNSIAREAIEQRKRRCGNCYCYDNVMMYCSDDCGREMGEHEFCSRWEARDE